MKRIISLFMVFCILFCMALPAMAMEPESVPPLGESTEATTPSALSAAVMYYTQVKVTVTDRSDNPLADAVFHIYRASDDAFMQEIVSDTNGIALSAQLPADGDYYMLEITAPKGYRWDCRYFTLKTLDFCANTQTDLTVRYTPITGQVKVIKSGDDGTLLSGVTFGIYDAVSNAQINTITTGTTGTSGVAVSGTLNYGDYYLKELNTVSGYELLTEPIPFSIEQNNVTVELPVVNYRIMGGVSLLKLGGAMQVSRANTPLSGAIFGLYNEQGQKLTELTTGTDGYASYNSLPQGNYYLKELSAPQGYVMSDEIFPFTISRNGEIAEVTAFNRMGYSTVKVQKTGENGVLAGVVFDVYHASTNEKVGSITTDTGGIATLELPLDNYYLVETATAPGYALLKERISFALTTDGKTVTLPIQNVKETIPTVKPGKLLIFKKADKTGEKLSGAVFGVYETVTDKKVIELTTDRYGEATATLNVGDYYLRELEAPAGYILNTDRVTFKITSEVTKEIAVINKVKTVTDPTPTEKPGKLLIIKKADKTGDKLKGAVFGVYETLTDKKVVELTTDRYGEATATLDAGEYYLRELEAPTGYVLDTSRVSFRIKSDKVEEITVTNKAKVATDPNPTEQTGKLLIIKKADKSGDKLKGAVFGVYETLTDKKVMELITDRYGEATATLDVGEYYLRELEAPFGYVLDSSRISFQIASSKTKEITVTNKPVADTSKPTDKPTETPKPTDKPTTTPTPTTKGKLELVKKAEGTGKPLCGAVFGVYNAQKNIKVGEVTSNANGKAVLELPDGRYYLLEQKSPQGYLKETAKILFEVKAGTTTIVEITNMRDPNSLPYIEIPKTGEAYPMMTYTLSALFMGLALICGIVLYRKRKTA